MAMMKPGLIQPAQVNQASTKACTAISDCTPISPFFLSCLSIQAPASGPTTNCGIRPQKAVMPSSAAEPVSRYTSQASATCWIHEPRMETAWPAK